jgi:hypothetical protein
LYVIPRYEEIGFQVRIYKPSERAQGILDGKRIASKSEVSVKDEIQEGHAAENIVGTPETEKRLNSHRKPRYRG